MNIDQSTTLLLAISSLSLGAFLGILRNKLLGSLVKSSLRYIFYVISISCWIAGIIFAIAFWSDLPSNSFNIIVLIASFLSGGVLFWFTYKYFEIKDTYGIKELDPIVNAFTEDADKNEIKLFAGDLNFFGNTPNEMEQNHQYTFLKSMGFKRVSILCEEPREAYDKIRYGKILYELSPVVFGFYESEKADLRIRGRMKQFQGVTRLLIYTKIKSGKYRAIETDTANSHGALYNNIWDLLWSLAKKPNANQIEEYKVLFKAK